MWETIAWQAHLLDVETRLVVLGSKLRGMCGSSILHQLLLSEQHQTSFLQFLSLQICQGFMKDVYPYCGLLLRVMILDSPHWFQSSRGCPVSWSRLAKMKGNRSWQRACISDDKTNAACRWTAFVSDGEKGIKDDSRWWSCHSPGYRNKERVPNMLGKKRFPFWTC